ncbi:EAL domain-containing protein [Herbaspirillum rubrisubalbicans]|uniref:EAL domain-containing protein n=1 Tax=Herbaspirillum rubrisubalbicans TaxID=80842 RepID=A0AAD0XER6_9BURK|nr:EAL domain-containing protein [Herbaspirillum rubrisubalbicans]AYR23376.1 EAL domain-containing protein [Herbaspirillum rubrisubalbicans]
MYESFLLNGNIAEGVVMGMGSLLLVCIENYEQLLASKGAEAIDEIQAQVLLRVANICGTKGGLVGVLSPGRLGVCWDMGQRGEFIQQDDMHRQALAKEISCDLQSLFGGGAEWNISVAWGGDGALSSQLESTEYLWPPSHDESDVRIAESVYAALKEDRVMLDFEPVCCVFESSSSLYFESLVRLLSATGERLLPGEFIPALERLGLMRCLDRYVVRSVFKTLEQHPDIRLGVNISAQSAINDVWWRSTFADLMSRPDIARRLVVEITETAKLKAGTGRRFSQYLQRLGCQVAIDDFGAGFAKEAAREVQVPDVIKIDRGILRRTREAGQEGLLEEVLSAAHRQCSLVIVEGVETDHDRLTVARSGGRWAQGRYFHRAAGQIAFG